MTPEEKLFIDIENLYNLVITLKEQNTALSDRLDIVENDLSIAEAWIRDRDTYN